LYQPRTVDAKASQSFPNGEAEVGDRAQKSKAARKDSLKEQG